MSPPIRWLRASPWASAAALYAWCAAIVLTVLIQLGTLLIVVPPALVASAPLMVPPRHQPLTSVLAALVLAVWAVFGLTWLGGYFLPSALLLAVGYARARLQEPRRC